MVMVKGSRRWLCVALLALMLGILATCSSQGGEAAQPDDPTQTPPTATAVPTAVVVGRYSEYRISMALEPSKRRLEGQQEVTFPNHTGVDLDEVVFRLYPNLPQYGGAISVGPVTVDGEQRPTSLRADGTALSVSLEHPLAPEHSVTIEMAFDVEIPVRESGYSLFGMRGGIWSLPDIYPLLAVHDGVAWHEDIAPAHGDAVFADAALYEVSLTLPPTLTLVANGSVVSDMLGQDGRTYHISGGPLREFAFLASEQYQLAEAGAQGTTLRAYYLPGDEAAAQATLEFAAAALPAYEDAFGPYPFDEMVIAEAPLLYYGMEYAGLNLIGSDLYREQGPELENRVVHEIAHQWWYAQVGNDQVNTPWLDEGLAEYSMAIYYLHAAGPARAEALISQRWQLPYQVAIDNQYDAVVNQPSSAFGWEYEVIVYGKAALFFHALHQQVGDELFKAILHEYVNRYLWDFATPEEFLAVAESVSGQDLEALYNHWILSSSE